MYSDMSILIVDDSPDECALLQQMLTSSGYSRVRTASSAREAFQQLGLEQESKKSHCDLILMDVIMPDINGIEACSRIKSNPLHRDVPILMVTVNHSLDSLQSAFDAGAVQYITKPVNKTDLLARIGSMLKLKHEINERNAIEQELQGRNRELEEALKVAHLLPKPIHICAWCRRVENDQGEWQPLEDYLRQRSLAKFTHGACPDCQADQIQ